MPINKKVAIPVAVIALAASAAGMSVFAHPNNDKQGMSSEEKQAIESAMESRDYSAWKEAVGDKPIADQVTEENFDQFAEARDLAESGDKEGAKAIMDELGIKPPQHGHHGPRDDEAHEAIEAALEAGDYNAWKEAVGDRPGSEKITEENFDRLVEAHNLRESGDKEGAKAIMDELGLKPPHHDHGPDDEGEDEVEDTDGDNETEEVQGK